MLTAKSSDEDIVQGLTLGADDYVAKPFSVTQLVLRVQAVLRRSGIGEADEREIRLINGIVVDSENLCAEVKEAKIVFTRREMDLLQYLKQQADRPVGHGRLADRQSHSGSRKALRFCNGNKRFELANIHLKCLCHGFSNEVKQ